MTKIRRLAWFLIGAQAADVATFALFFWLVPASGFVEKNPLIASVYGLAGVAGVALLKMGITAVVAYKAGSQDVVRVRLVSTLLVVAATSGVVGACFNTLAIVRSF